MWDKNLVSEQTLELCPMRTLLLAPQSTVREFNAYRAEIYPLWKRGMFIYPGGAGDQPARDIAMMLELDRTDGIVKAKYDEITAAENAPEGNA